MTKAVELKPCPFCGSAAGTDLSELPWGEGTWAIRCSNFHCGITTPRYESKDQAVATWNCRAADGDTIGPIVDVATNDPYHEGS